MNLDYTLLLHSPLFQGISAEDLPHLLICLKASIKDYEASQYIFRLGDEVQTIGIVLKGRLEIVKENIAGNRTILTVLTEGHIFGEGIVCTKARRSPISVRVQADATILFIPYHYIIKSCGNACSFHTQLITNMLIILGEKNYFLNTKMDLLILKGIQEKVITYLLQQSQKHNSLSFNIPLNRTELSEFLNVSRTSMCRELAVLKDEKLLDYYKNSFKLLDVEGLKKKLS